MRRLLALLLVSSYISGSLLAAWGWSMHRVITEPDRIMDVLAEHQVFAVVRTTVVQQALTQSLAQYPLDDTPLAEADVRAIVDETFESSWFEEETRINIRAFTRWLTGATDDLHLSVSLSHIADQGFASLTKKLDDALRAIPTCTKEEASRVQRGEQVLCRPAGVSLATLHQTFDDQRSAMEQEYRASVPPEFNIVDSLQAQNPAALDALYAVRGYYVTIRAGFIALLLLLAAVLALIALCIGKPVWRALRWVASAVLLSGMALIVTGCMVQYVLPYLFSLLPVPPSVPEQASVLVRIMQEAFADVFGLIAIPVIVIGIITLVIGIVMRLMAHVPPTFPASGQSTAPTPSSY